ncbi:MAG: hypothetical protein KGK09_00505, partial [Burkholderiales bacterium]|nr:hypothetical protein [Burkholderiales bacterium]
MQLHRPWLALVLASACAFAATAASAAAIGANGADVTLGQPLDYAVQVRLAPGESINPGCVAAQVTLGERQVPATQVRTVLRMESPDVAQVRVLTTRPVDEPVVGVVVQAGCNSPLTRRFVVLADPPLTPPAAAVPAYAAAPPPAETTAPAGMPVQAGRPVASVAPLAPLPPQPGLAAAAVTGKASGALKPEHTPPRRARRAEPLRKPHVAQPVEVARA